MGPERKMDTSSNGRRELSLMPPKRRSTHKKDSSAFLTTTEVTERTRPTTPAHRTHTRQGRGTVRACAGRAPLMSPPRREETPPPRREETQSHPNMDPRGTRPHRAVANAPATQTKQPEVPLKATWRPPERETTGCTPTTGNPRSARAATDLLASTSRRWHSRPAQSRPDLSCHPKMPGLTSSAPDLAPPEPRRTTSQTGSVPDTTTSTPKSVDRPHQPFPKEGGYRNR